MLHPPFWEEPRLMLCLILSTLVGITAHELGHALAATVQGDPTARARGHLTLNPWVLMGRWSLLLLALTGVGWGATPLGEDLQRRPRAFALVCLAGPLANLLLALLAMGLFMLGARWWMAAGGTVDDLDTYLDLPLSQALQALSLANLFIGVVNLLPVPPLDGGRLLATSLPALRRFEDWDGSLVVAVVVVVGLSLLPPAQEFVGHVHDGLLWLWA